MRKFLLSGLLSCLLLCIAGCGAAKESSAGKIAEEQAKNVKTTEEIEEKNQTDTERLAAELSSEIEDGNGMTTEETAEAVPRGLITAMPPSISLKDAKDVSIVISKTDHTLTLFNGQDEIAVYSVGLASNPVGAKEKEGDHKNPEGEYYVCNKNSGSQYHLALGLSYPNREDALRGYEEGLITKAERDSILHEIENGGKPDWYTALGGEIMIHGQKGDLGGSTDWTRGCFAVDNEVMDYIWDYILVGTKVTITE